MRVLMMTQALDPRDPLLAFTTGWASAIASRIDHLHVVCLRATEQPSVANVTTHAIGARDEAGRLRRLAAFERAVWTALADVDVVFGHMVPEYICWSAPAAVFRRRPAILWYAHRQDSLQLRVATALSRFVATAAPSSFPFSSRKVQVVGHGIDQDFFGPDSEVEPDSPPVVIFVARLMAIKHQATLLHALAQLAPRHASLRALFVGGVPDGRDADYARMLRALARDLGLEARATFTGPLPPGRVRDLYRRATVAVNLSPHGLFDKAPLESLMVGTPTIVASPSFDELLGRSAAWLRIEAPDAAASLAAALDRVLDMPGPARRELTSAVCERARAAHGLQRSMDRLVALMRAAAGDR
jgi:glycosyltransferase involved in cell wall biosynthesis